ncbi:MAG: stage III sporulation protein AF [Anaerolineae bacterium]|nr:stage III sporulation protein AF [Anaerolineae bacterium]
MALVLAFAEMLLPRNDLRKFARVVIGLVLVAIILGSLVDLPSLEDALQVPLAAPRPGAATRAATEAATGVAAGAVAGTGTRTGTGTTTYVADHAAQQDWATAGDMVARAGLQVAGRNARERFARQVESLARLASGAEAVDAEVDLAPSGELAGIRVVVRAAATIGHGLDSDTDCNRGGGSPGGAGVSGQLLAGRIERAIRDFYGLDSDFPVMVRIQA